jgi:molybdate transport system substrate-binding protein
VIGEAQRVARAIGLVGVLLASPLHAGKITIAAAASTRAAVDELVAAFAVARPEDEASVVYGASGKLFAQIRQGAPYDVFVSADTAYPDAIRDASVGAGPVQVYGFGRLVLWRRDCRDGLPTLQGLTDAHVTRIAIANPDLAPYGERARQAMQAAGVWAAVEHKLVFGENVGQAAQFALSGNAQVGIIALSLALTPAMRDAGCHAEIRADLYAPLAQGLVLTERGSRNALAAAFVTFMLGAEARSILRRHGLDSSAATPR